MTDITERMEKLLESLPGSQEWVEMYLGRFDEANDESAGGDFDRDSPASLVQDLASSKAVVTGRV